MLFDAFIVLFSCFHLTTFGSVFVTLTFWLLPVVANCYSQLFLIWCSVCCCCCAFCCLLSMLMLIPTVMVCYFHCSIDVILWLSRYCCYSLLLIIHFDLLFVLLLFDALGVEAVDDHSIHWPDIPVTLQVGVDGVIVCWAMVLSVAWPGIAIVLPTFDVLIRIVRHALLFDVAHSHLLFCIHYVHC